MHYNYNYLKHVYVDLYVLTTILLSNFVSLGPVCLCLKLALLTHTSRAHTHIYTDKQFANGPENCDGLDTSD